MGLESSAEQLVGIDYSKYEIVRLSSDLDAIPYNSRRIIISDLSDADIDFIIQRFRGVYGVHQIYKSAGGNIVLRLCPGANINPGNLIEAVLITLEDGFSLELHVKKHGS